MFLSNWYKSVIHSLQTEISEIKNIQKEKEEDGKRSLDNLSNLVVNLSNSISKIQESHDELNESFRKVRNQAANAEKKVLSLRFLLNSFLKIKPIVLVKVNQNTSDCRN